MLCEAFLYVGAQVELPDTGNNFHIIWNIQVFGLSYPFQKMDKPLTCNIIEYNGKRNVVHLIIQCLADCIIHVHMPTGLVQFSIPFNPFPEFCSTHLSPFWKSTTE